MTEPISAYPLQWPSGWPRAKERKRAQFGKGERQYSSTGTGSWINMRDLTISDGVKRVLAELERLNVGRGNAIISTNVKVRLDGLPYSDQRAPEDPGVAVYWRVQNKGQMKVMAVDRYDRVADNLAAIAATLNAMRAIERHGGAQILERAFTGFTALPGVPTCWDVLGVKRDASREEVEGAFRDLAKRHHPDAGGSHDEFIRIQTAREQALGEAGR
jgi:hypothetical protein